MGGSISCRRGPRPSPRAKTETSFEEFNVKKHGALKVEGRAVGAKIAFGKARVIEHLSELSQFVPGEILVADTTSPDWGTVMKAAAGIVTNRGGRTCHAAIVARELGIPAIVGTDRGNACHPHRRHDLGMLRGRRHRQGL